MSTLLEPAPGTAESSDYAVSIIAPLADGLRSTCGASALADACRAAGIETAWLDDRARRVDRGPLETFLETARERLASDDAFMAACASGNGPRSGLLRAALHAVTPGLAYRIPGRAIGFDTASGRFACARRGPGWSQLRYTSAHPESRLLCLLRQGRLVHVPTAWDLPAATLREGTCIARGEDACEYLVHWHGRPAWSAALLATISGAAIGMALQAVLPGSGLRRSLPLAVAAAAGALTWWRDTARARRMSDAAGRQFTSVFVWAATRAGDAGGGRARPAPEARPDEPATPARDDDGLPLLRQEGQFWSITWRGTTVMLRHSRGLGFLAHLMRNPGQDIHVRTLDALTPSTTGAAPDGGALGVPSAGEVSAGPGDAGEVLDARARAEYRRRMRDLRERLDEAEACNDLGRAAAARQELEMLAEQLRGAVGLGGRSRRASSDADRVRVAVTRRIRAAIAQIGRHHPALGEHFEASVRTGFVCTYAPATAPPTPLPPPLPAPGSSRPREPLGVPGRPAHGPAPRQETAVILFVDIADSTALTERLGDEAFRNCARELDTTLRAVIQAAAGKPVEGKLLGDGVLAVFTSARAAIEAALRCGKAGGAVGLALHVGLHAGDVIEEGENVYGGAVNVAARVAAQSMPGEVLLTDTVRALARTSAGVVFTERGEHVLKGVAEPLRLFVVSAR